MGLVAPWHVGSSQTRARTRVPCIGRQILNHCATREAQDSQFLYILILSMKIKLQIGVSIIKHFGPQTLTTVVCVADKEAKFVTV